MIAAVALAVAWQNRWTSGIAVMMSMVGLFVFYMRSEAGIKIRGFKIHAIAVVLFVVAAAMLAMGIVGFVSPAQAKFKAFLFSGMLVFALSYLVAKFHQPAEKRSLRLGVGAYLLLFTSMAVGTASQVWDWDGSNARRAALIAEMPAFDATKFTEAELKALRNKKDKTEKEEVMLAKAVSAANQVKKMKRDEEERHILSKGSYWEAVKFRAANFSRHAPNEFNTCALFIAVFLIGYWFVRSGVMENTAQYLPLFKRLAFIALPLGISLGLASSLMAVRATTDSEGDIFQFATSLLYIGNLAACLGYVGLMIVMLHSKGVFANVKVLAPYGRMALTNYLSQSVISSAIFYAYGLGLYGMPRAQQVLVVAVVVPLQVAFSHWWLSKFLYGPMEWLWRAITYWKLPRFKISKA